MSTEKNAPRNRGHVRREAWRVERVASEPASAVERWRLLSGVEWPGTQRGWMYTDSGRRGERGVGGVEGREKVKREQRKKDGRWNARRTENWLRGGWRVGGGGEGGWGV